MKKSFFLAFLIMLFSLTLFGCKKEKPTVDIVLESTHESISYDLVFNNIKSDANRKYKIVLYTEGTTVVEDVNLLTEVSGEFKNLAYNTVYSVSVFISKNAKSTDFNNEIGNKSISTTLNEFKNVTFENVNTVYDGKPKFITVNGAPEGTNVEYIGTNFEYNEKTGVTEAGTYEVTAKLTKEGYKELALKANIIISKGTHSLKLEDVTKTYDGKPINVNLDTNLPITYEYYSGDTKLEAAPSDVGVYTVKAIYAGDNNYKGFELTAKYTIKEADTDIILKNKTVTYNGEAQELVADTTLDVTYEYYLNNEKLTSKPVNVGVYTVKAIFAGDKNHTAKTVEATLTIIKADTNINVSSKDVQVDYGKTFDLNAVVSNGATPTIVYNTTDGKAPVNVGKYTATISYAGDSNYNAAKDVVVNITIVQADIDLTFNDGVFTYDGEEKSLTIDTSLPIIYEYYLGETKLTSLPVNAGVYKVKAIFAGDANHEAKTVEATLTINKASTTIIPSVLVVDVVYGQDYEVTAKLENGVNVTPIYNTTDGKAPVNAGNYTATFKFEDPNYLPVDEVVVSITIRKVEVTIEVEEVEVTYDGKPHGVVPVLSNGATPTITYDTNDGEAPVNAGTYFATIVYAGDENHKPCEAVGIVNILRADVTITVDSEEVKVTYDGKPHGITATASNGATLTINYNTEDGEKPVNAGEYIASVICPENPNYNTPDSIYVDIIIEKATYDMSGIKFENKTVKYNGLDYTIEITGELPEGVEVGYENNIGRNADTYDAIAHFVGDEINYNLIPDKKATLTIEKADVVITASDITVNYEEDYEVTYVCDFTCKIEYYEDGVLLSSKPTEMNKNYTAKITYAGDENHNAASKTISINIVDPNYENLEIYLDDMEYTWGESVFINPTTSRPEITRLDLSIVITNASGEVVEEDLKPGQYTVTVIFERNTELGINKAVKTANLVILKQTTTITPDNESLSTIYHPELVIDAQARVSNGETAKVAFFDINNNELKQSPKAVGKYKVVYSYAGDEYYKKAQDVTIEFEIYKSPSYIIVARDTFNITPLDDENIEEILAAAYLTPNPSGSDYIIDAKPTLTYEGGSLPTTPGEHKAYLSFAGNDCYEAAETVVITIYYFQVEDKITTNANRIEIYVDEEINLEYSSEYDREISIVYKDLFGNVVEEDDLIAGNYIIELTTKTDDQYTGAKKEVELVIKKYDAVIETETLEIEKDYDGQPVIVTATVTGDNVPTINYGRSDGIDLVDNNIVDAGNYFAVITFSGNEKYNAAEPVEVVIIINKVAIEDTSVAPKEIMVKYYEGIIVQGIYSDLADNSLYAIDETQELQLGSNNVQVKYHLDNNHIDYEYTLKVVVKKYIRGWGVEQVGRQITGRDFDPSIIKIGVTYEHDEFEYLDTSKYEVKLAEGQTTSDPYITLIITVSSFGSNVYDNGQGFTAQYEIPTISSPEIMIYAVYGAGGNSGASYKNDFVILYNANNTAYNLQDFVLWRYSEKGTTPEEEYALSGFIDAYSFYVIQCGGGNYDVPQLPFEVDDDKCTLNFAESNFKVLLTVSPKEVDLSNYTTSNYVDILGVGTATNFEGTGPAPAIDKTSYIKRKNLVDTNNDNANDFEKVLFVNETFIFLNDGYSAYVELDQTLTDLNIGSDKIEVETEFYVPSVIQNRKITWTAYENGEVSALVTINENGRVLANPVTGEVHSVLLVGTIENSDFTVTRSLNLSNLQSLGNLVVTLTDFIVSWNRLENATSYEVYLAGDLVDTILPEEELKYDLTGATANMDVYVIAKAPTGYVDATSNTVYFDHDSLIEQIVDDALEAADEKIEDSYTILDSTTIDALTSSEGKLNTTFTYSSEDSIVSIVDNKITISKPEVETTVKILITASIAGQNLTDNTKELTIRVIPAEANYLLTKVTDISQLKDGTQIILTSKNDTVTMGSFNDSNYYNPLDITLAEEMYISEDFGLTIITLIKENDKWILKVAENSYLCWKSGNSVTISEELEANSMWTLSTDGNNISVINSADNTRLLKYNSSNPRFACYTSAQTALSAYIIEDIYHGKNKQTLNEISFDEEYRINDTKTFELPQAGTRFDYVSLSYEVTNGSIEDYVLSVEKPEISVTVTLTVTATIMNGDQQVQDSRTITFVVKNDDYRLDISNDVVVTPINDQTWTGSEITPTVEVKYNDIILTKDTEYTVEYTNNTNAGTATITITFIGKDYTGTKEVTFNITKEAIDITETVVIADIEDQIFEDVVVTPDVEVTYDGNTLLKGTDYELSYNNNDKVGIATVTITFKGNYKGIVTKEFNIIEKVIGPTTVTVSIADYAAANGWEDATKYTTLNIDENIFITTTGSNNSPKYYASGNDWRFYQSYSTTLTISSEKTIISIKITYNISNSGTLVANEANVASGEILSVNSSTITFSVGNTGTKTNGQVKITAIEIVYQ